MSSPKLLKTRLAKPITNPESTICKPKINPPKLAF
jgi:hypothetical protein